ncbi:hypothetical protein PoB_007006800 [Plakobranchus ocellatus]|uniref:Uncharacterized protein n=1 Tax=Plakobranchus ocellatus TaxID=259542 RepID=A0AAV4DGZ3_9GAST|nr:hypothetical protein PoB_007006800 [Plakobranchus ocellatus]
MYRFSLSFLIVILKLVTDHIRGSYGTPSDTMAAMVYTGRIQPFQQNRQHVIAWLVNLTEGALDAVVFPDDDRAGSALIVLVSSLFILDSVTWRPQAIHQHSDNSPVIW